MLGANPTGFTVISVWKMKSWRDTIQGYLALSDAGDHEYSTIFFVPKIMSAQELVSKFHETFYRQTNLYGRQINSTFSNEDDFYMFNERELEWLRTHCDLRCVQRLDWTGSNMSRCRLSRARLALHIAKQLVLGRQLPNRSLIAHQPLEVRRDVACTGVISREMQLAAMDADVIIARSSLAAQRTTLRQPFL